MFFLHHEEDVEEHPSTDYARVLYVPAGTRTQEAAPPSDHDSSTFFCESIPFLAPERQITAQVLPELPDWFSSSNNCFTVSALNDERWRLQREEGQRLVGEWLLLAQFPTQSEVYYGCFLIRAEDLGAKRFDRIRSFTMFTE